MPKIHQLSQSIINKIAAGEVIERPASVVKELVENAVDAGATRVDIAVEGGGRDMIRVVDNGCGIGLEQLPLAIASHATSKIATADDLFSVGTLGFRGEALASIAEISRFVIRSRTPDSAEGAEMEVVGGNASPATPQGCPVGTMIEVHNLFFNTPVRRKFLKTTQTEFGHVSEAVSRIAMPHPRVHFTLRHNNRLVHELPSETLLERIGRLAGKQASEHLIPVESEHEGVRLSGYVAHPRESRSNAKSQYLFLNGRHIRDRALQHALAEAYRGLLTTGRYPVAFLFLEMPAEMVDVNVHPTKLEVRFQDGGRLYSHLLGTLRTKFLSTDMTTHVELHGDSAESERDDAHDPDATAKFRQQVIDWAKTDDFTTGADAPSSGVSVHESQPVRPVGARGASGGGSFGSSPSRAPLQLHSLDSPAFRPYPGGARGGTAIADPASSDVEGDADVSASSEKHWRADPPHTNAIQVHDRYIVAEGPEGLLVIDQHALHERILFEKFKARLEEGRVDTQNLLIPEPVDLSAPEREAALEHRETLASLGLKIEPFGGETILVTSYPSFLANVKPEELLRTVIERIMTQEKSPSLVELTDGLLETMACKAAIKAGDPLSPEEIDSLLAERAKAPDEHHCPHGRPSVLVFPCDELDKRFKRT